MGDSPRGYEERGYRGLQTAGDLVSFEVRVKETDLYIRAERDLSEAALDSVLRCRRQLENYILGHASFFHSLEPLEDDAFAPPVVRAMLRAGIRAGVGPMAAVAGAVADCVGADLLKDSEQVIVENGGDIFLRTSGETKIAIYAGDSPLSFRIGIRIPPLPGSRGVCTSSATVGPSLSFGRADAATVMAGSAALADAAATAVGNAVRSPSDLEAALERARSIEGVTGAVIVLGPKLAVWGQVELIKIDTGIDPGPDSRGRPN
ncbi:MAG TPA: UPF0280 family protein [Thermodesulfobacteriota bacterium]|nr:UPF0280 family protein [Thermodesulfobacteriota bacterium]